MSADFSGLPFRPADILLPQDCDYDKWSVVACDQYTSQPEYWQRVEERVGRAPSALRLILPESSLDGPQVEMDIMDINSTMARYVREGRFKTLPGAMVYVERTLFNGKVRRGLVGMADLTAYDYEPDADVLIRATEGVVHTRIPPRVAVRKNAPIELPHAMLLTDDPMGTVIEPLAAQTASMELLYDFDLMEQGGHVKGWRLSEDQLKGVATALSALADPAAFNARYGTANQPVMLFAVGDGNHSLATAKECYERQKRLMPPEKWDGLPARFALCELVNLHDESLEFEPIHRVVFHTDPDALLDALVRAYPGARRSRTAGEGLPLCYLFAGGEGVVTLPASAARLPVGALQSFLDDYLMDHEGRVDYIHGEDVAREFAARPGNIAFLLPPMDKEELFPSVIHDGVLPRKTFSMGEAHDKRFYLEARKIR